MIEQALNVRKLLKQNTSTGLFVEFSLFAIPSEIHGPTALVSTRGLLEIQKLPNQDLHANKIPRVFNHQQGII